jgi:hypothetical protein
MTVHVVYSNSGGESDPVAIAAAIAALVTALITLIVATATRRTADATAARTRLLQERADEERRPVLIPLVVEPGPLSPAGPTDPQGHVDIPLRNIGAGPALNISIAQTHSAAAELPHAGRHAKRLPVVASAIRYAPL